MAREVRIDTAVTTVVHDAEARPGLLVSRFDRLTEPSGETRHLAFEDACQGLTGNGDVHAKNLSILATTDGEWRVAPAYDLPSTVP